VDNAFLQSANAFVRVCLSVCVSVYLMCVCFDSALTFESLDLQVHLKNILIKFVYQGQWVKVKVRGAKTGYTSFCGL